MSESTQQPAAELVAFAAAHETLPLEAQRPSVAQDSLKVLEAAILCAARKVTMEDLLQVFFGNIERSEVIRLLGALERRWSDKGFELANAGRFWWVRPRQDIRQKMAEAAKRNAERPTRAMLEVLAVIAYRQPCTKLDVEGWRKAQTPAGVFEQLEQRGWIEVIGHRRNAHAHALFATTNKFLDEMRLLTLDELPPVDPDSLERLPGDADGLEQQPLE